MPSDYTYLGYGLNIRSEIFFPEFLRADFESADVNITLAKNLANPEDEANWDKSYSKQKKDGIFFQVLKVARYLVKNGNEIKVEPFQAGDPGAVRLFLLSNAMAILLIQRGQILLHASAIRQDDGLVVFIGDSGAGKSSMLAELVRRGHEPFSDDVIVLEEDPVSGEIIALPSYPMIKLWKETMDILGTETTGKGHRLREGVDKFGHFFHDRYSTHPMRIKQVIVIEKDPTCERYRRMEPGGLDSFEILSRNIYRRQYIQQDKLRKKHLVLLGKLLGQARVTILIRPDGQGTISGFTDFAEIQLKPGNK